MKYIKGYNESFRLKTGELDFKLLKDLIISDLDGDVYSIEHGDQFKKIDTLSCIEFGRASYLEDGNGSPILYKDTWFNTNVNFTKSADAASNNPIRILGKIIKKWKYGISLEVSKSKLDQMDCEMDIRESFFCIIRILKTLNMERLSEYEIGCCLLKDGGNFKILFYPL